jgi:hypothetical protein
LGIFVNFTLPTDWYPAVRNQIAAPEAETIVLYHGLLEVEDADLLLLRCKNSYFKSKLGSVQTDKQLPK